MGTPHERRCVANDRVSPFSTNHLPDKSLADILLSTLNARYIHASFGLRYLKANMGELASRTDILEFVIEERPLDVVERLLAERPRIIGLGVYIWNVDAIAAVVKLLKLIAPETFVVLGGPEVSYSGHEDWIEPFVDVVVAGEADVVFPKVCEDLLAGKPIERAHIQAAPPNFEELQLPYEYYTDADIANRIVYVEASRGCPFKCEFCLSSLDVAVRKPPIERFLAAMDSLLARGVRQFKFVDRTFNLNLRFSRAILSFFLERYEEGMFLHFEMIPDRLPEGLKELIVQFPPGTLQFEVGVQTLDPEVSDRINRRQVVSKLQSNLRFLRSETGVHVHADLICGLPGETLESFGSGFDALHAMGPQEIQVGILKKLKGTTLGRHDENFGMRYSPGPPYEILETSAISFEAMQTMRRFARYWDLFANSGNFRDSLPFVWGDKSPFQGFMDFCSFLTERLGRTHKISLARQTQMLFAYLCERQGMVAEEAALAILSDYRRIGRREIPPFLRDALPPERLRAYKEGSSTEASRAKRNIPARQARHLG